MRVLLESAAECRFSTVAIFTPVSVPTPPAMASMCRRTSPTARSTSSTKATFLPKTTASTPGPMASTALSASRIAGRSIPTLASRPKPTLKAARLASLTQATSKAPVPASSLIPGRRTAPSPSPIAGQRCRTARASSVPASASELSLLAAAAMSRSTIAELPRVLELTASGYTPWPSGRAAVTSSPIPAPSMAIMPASWR